ncbi:coiled-coil domain-containing protein 170 isoform X3 [Marmota marmota marmota]|uniref:coiled-coil domain-containing protein 170 isoform X3 n=1 Tax=Marmota marmota marmota TaxID=9994 RepID=UPI002093A968|nr:coiled-coil domain-containing protein 170 isoform X3 [Marmota marmota marmota]
MSRRGSSGSRSLDASSHAASPAPEETRDHSLEVPVSREQLNHYRNVVENVRSELAATLVKFESAQSELRDLRSKMLSKEVSCQELKAEMENYKENNARKSSLLTSLRDRVQELEEESAALSASKIRTELTAHAAIKENQELMKRVVELEEKLQKCSKENEENKKQVSKHSRKHEEFLIQLHDSLDPDKRSEKASEEDLILKDLLSAMEAKEALEREVKVFQERLLAGQRAWDASKQELSLLKKSSCELEKSLKVSREVATASESQNASFREKVAGLLTGLWGMTGSTEDAILERIQEMGSQEEDGRRMVSQLEAQRAELVEQLGKVSESHQEALQRAHKAEDKLETLQGQLTHLEGELVSSDVLRDNLNFEKQKYLKFLDQLSEKMRLDRMAAELGFDMRLDVVLARAEQLVRLESSAVVENKTIAYNLQRKLKTQKERLESRELHMNLLRQKIAQLEEEKQVRSALATERDEAQLTIRKLEMKVGRMQKELNVCRESNLELKAKLADTSELKIKTLEQTKTIEHLNKSRDQLEKMKEKVEKQLSSVRAELDTAGREAEEGKERARHMLEAVTSEMKTLKRSLEDAEKREKQLADFREVVSQMLGLNMTALALPDYEIIKCLERLIHLHQHRLVSCACLKDMTSGQDRHPQGHLKLLH